MEQAVSAAPKRGAGAEEAHAYLREDDAQGDVVQTALVEVSSYRLVRFEVVQAQIPRVEVGVVDGRRLEGVQLRATPDELSA
jgi:hypothetical protein